MPAHGVDDVVGSAHRIRRTHEKVDGPEAVLFEPESFANGSLDAVAVDGTGGMLARDQDSQPRPPRRTPREKERVAADRAALAGAQQSLELRLAPQAALRVERKALRRRR